VEIVNPLTGAPLVDALGREDVVRLSPPGFAAPLPDGFPATYLAYRDSGFLSQAVESVLCCGTARFGAGVT
jgi:hypothetical protein